MSESNQDIMNNDSEVSEINKILNRSRILEQQQLQQQDKTIQTTEDMQQPMNLIQQDASTSPLKNMNLKNNNNNHKSDSHLPTIGAHSKNSDSNRKNSYNSNHQIYHNPQPHFPKKHMQQQRHQSQQYNNPIWKMNLGKKRYSNSILSNRQSIEPEFDDYESYQISPNKMRGSLDSNSIRNSNSGKNIYYKPYFKHRGSGGGKKVYNHAANQSDILHSQYSSQKIMNTEGLEQIDESYYDQASFFSPQKKSSSYNNHNDQYYSQKKNVGSALRGQAREKQIEILYKLRHIKQIYEKCNYRPTTQISYKVLGLLESINSSEDNLYGEDMLMLIQVLKELIHSDHPMEINLYTYLQKHQVLDLQESDLEKFLRKNENNFVNCINIEELPDKDKKIPTFYYYSKMLQQILTTLIQMFNQRCDKIDVLEQELSEIYDKHAKEVGVIHKNYKEQIQGINDVFQEKESGYLKKIEKQQQEFQDLQDKYDEMKTEYTQKKYQFNEQEMLVNKFKAEMILTKKETDDVQWQLKKYKKESEGAGEVRKKIQQQLEKCGYQLKEVQDQNTALQQQIKSLNDFTEYKELFKKMQLNADLLEIYDEKTFLNLNLKQMKREEFDQILHDFMDEVQEKQVKCKSPRSKPKKKTSQYRNSSKSSFSQLYESNNNGSQGNININLNKADSSGPQTLKKRGTMKMTRNDSIDTNQTPILTPKEPIKEEKE